MKTLLIALVLGTLNLNSASATVQDDISREALAALLANAGQVHSKDISAKEFPSYLADLLIDSGNEEEGGYAFRREINGDCNEAYTACSVVVTTRMYTRSGENLVAVGDSQATEISMATKKVNGALKLAKPIVKITDR